MNFLDIIKEFNGKVLHESDIYYIVDKHDNNCYFRQSYLHQELLIVKIEYRKYYYINSIIHIDDLREAILNFFNSNVYYFYKYYKYIYVPSKYITPANDKYINVSTLGKDCDILNTDLIILEFDNGFYKLPNTDIYIYTLFKYTFHMDDFNIIPLLKYFKRYLKHHWSHNKNYQRINNSDELVSVDVTIFFNKEEFNDITSRLKNETIFDILNINKFRRKQ